MNTYRTDFAAASREETLAMVRAERDRILADTVDRMNPMRWASLSPEKQAEWAAYRSALLSITNKVPASTVTWPSMPSDKDVPTETPEEPTAE